MPAPHPPEFPQRAVGLARMRDKPIRLVAKISGSPRRYEVTPVGSEVVAGRGLTHTYSWVTE